MKIAVLICRILLGLGFMIFGANIIHSFLPQPPFVPGSLPEQFMLVMVPTHWMMLVGFVQLIGGALVLSGRMTPLGLCLLAPVLFNVLAFHTLLMNGDGIAPGIVFSAIEAFLIYAYRGYFRGIFTTDAKV